VGSQLHSISRGRLAAGQLAVVNFGTFWELDF
jgi:hypothetical protein